MSFEAKIRKEVDPDSMAWEDARMPDVIKYGKQADDLIRSLLREIRELEELVENLQEQGSGY